MPSKLADVLERDVSCGVDWLADQKSGAVVP
jgi:hypothetical protein